MGCTHSGDGRNGDVESFKVYNVNDHGVELHRGIIQIADGDLILYQKNKNPIRWPLRCLRRYGFDAELFSFESGRRCAMGSGIFAFRCTRAQELFNLVQDSIQRAGELIQPTQHHVQGPNNSNGGSSRLNRPTETVTNNLRTHQASNVMPPTTSWVPPVAVNGGYDNPNSNLYVNGTIAQNANAGHEYANTSFPSQNLDAFQIDRAAALVDFLHNPPSMANGRSQVNYAELCMPDSQGSSDANSPDNELDQHRLSHPVHVTENNYLPDVMAGAFHEDAGYAFSAESEISPQDTCAEDAASTNYVNISVDDNNGAVAAAAGPMPLQLPLQSSSSSAAQPLPLPPTTVLPSTHDVLTNYANLALPPQKASQQVNYILIDHETQNSENANGGASNSPISPTGLTPFPESPSRKTESYATIDFDRTVALSNATKPVEDEGGRKTRHNSTIEGIP